MHPVRKIHYYILKTLALKTNFHFSWINMENAEISGTAFLVQSDYIPCTL